MIKMTGAEWMAFESDPFWGENWYYDDASVLVDGVDRGDIAEDIPGDAKVTVEGGYINDGTESGKDLEKYIKHWRKSQTKTWFVVECDKARGDEIKDAVLLHGGKVVK